MSRPLIGLQISESFTRLANVPVIQGESDIFSNISFEYPEDFLSYREISLHLSTPVDRGYWFSNSLAALHRSAFKVDLVWGEIETSKRQLPFLKCSSSLSPYTLVNLFLKSRHEGHNTYIAWFEECCES